jgi:hypothetical protein
VIWIIGLQRVCVGIGFEVTVILQRIRDPKKVEGNEVDSRGIKLGPKRGVFEDGDDNFDSKTGKVCIQP